MSPVRRGALWAFACAVVLGVVSYLSNITSIAQLSGGADVLLAVRLFLSRVVNAGAVWAALPVLAGYLVRRPAVAAAAGIVAPLVALVVHYALAASTGWVAGLSWRDNQVWFAAVLVVGAPLGLIGALARRPGASGLAALLVVPVGAVLQPFVLGTIRPEDFLPWPTRFADVASSAVLIAVGLVTGVLAVRSRVGSVRRGQDPS